MIIGLYGAEEGLEDDPMFLIPPMPLDALIMNGPLAKDRREDIQILAFALAVSLTSEGNHPIDIRPGDDPPDRCVGIHGKFHSVELTELTVADVRKELARARKLGRDLGERLKSNTSHYPHLIGRQICLSVLPSEPLPRKTAPLLDSLCTLLKDDRGCFGDGVDFTNGLPERLPIECGSYKQSETVHVIVFPNGVPGEICVSGACQIEIRLTETFRVLEERVRAKDAPTNEILVMSCGMPDQHGYQCPVDVFMFNFIKSKLDHLILSPTHLKGVFLHLWGTNDWVQLYRSENSFPWPPESPRGS